MILSIAIIFFLILNGIAALKAMSHFKEKKILKGLHNTLLSLIAFLTFLFLLYNVGFNINFPTKLILTAFIVTKVFNAIFIYLRNVYLLEKKRNYTSNTLSFIIIFIVVFLLYLITNENFAIPDITYLYLETLSYLLIGANLVLWLQFSPEKRS
jgi:hypothetical protein